MDPQTSQSIAQQAENFLQRTALGVLLLAVVYTLAAVIYLLDESLAQPLEMLQTVLAVVAMLIVLPGFLRMLRLRVRRDCDFSEAESYIGGVFGKACVTGFSMSFVLLALIGPLSARLPAGLPTEFYTQSVLALTLGAFGITFFTALWHDRDLAGDDDFGAED